MVKVIKETYIVCGGGKAHIERKIEICPTILARIYKGYNTYGIPAVIEYERECESYKDNSLVQ